MPVRGATRVRLVRARALALSFSLPPESFVLELYLSCRVSCHPVCVHLSLSLGLLFASCPIVQSHGSISDRAQTSAPGRVLLLPASCRIGTALIMFTPLLVLPQVVGKRHPRWGSLFYCLLRILYSTHAEEGKRGMPVGQTRKKGLGGWALGCCVVR